MLLRSSGAKGFSETLVPTYWSTGQCRKTESKNMNLILRENHKLYWSVQLIWNTVKTAVNIETQTFCAQYGKMLMPEFAITVTFSARNEYRGRWSVQIHEDYIMKKCTLHLSHRTPFNSRSRHQSWRSKTPSVLDHLSPVEAIISDFTHCLPST